MFKKLFVTVNIIVLATSIVLMLDFTANNPTGRRFSSEVIDLDLDFRDKGLQGEQILAQDLGIQSNDSQNRVCLCNNPNQAPDPIACNSCLVYVDVLTQNRRPDFITDKFIIEVKNHDSLLYSQSSRDIVEIGEYALAAQELNIPLWLFVRTDTSIPTELQHMIESTGGKVVYYLRVPGHVDEVGRFARRTFIVVALFWIIVIWLSIRKYSKPYTLKPEKPPTAQSKVDDLEDFVKRAKDKNQVIIDVEDSSLE